MEKSIIKCFSHYPAKSLGGMDDGGCVCVDDERIYNYIKGARNHFKETNEDFGGNYRLGNVRAVYLNVRLNYIDEILARRKEIAEIYLRSLRELEYQGFIKLPNDQKGRVWQDWILRTEKRDELYEFLKEQGIETIKNEYPFSPEYPKLPLAAKYEAETLRIPCNENLEDFEVGQVIETIKNFYTK